MSLQPPQLWVFGGPNGTGKSTIVQRYLRNRLPIINPDVIAVEIGQVSAVPTIEAGKIALRQRAELLSARSSFAIETTLSGRSEIQLMREAKAAGCKVNLVFVEVKSSTVSRWRVAHRVRMGLHDVPVEDIVCRFDRSMSNLAIAMRIAHRTLVIDNTGRGFRLLLVREHERTRVTARVLPAWAMQAIPEDLR